MSLRKYILISILLILSSVGGVAIWGSYRASVHEAKELFDAQLSRSARLMLALAVAEIRDGHIKDMQTMIMQNRLEFEKPAAEDEYEEGDDDEAESSKGHYYELKLAFQVWDKHGNLILHSGLDKFTPLSQQQQGYSDSLLNGVPWRVFSMWSSDNEYLVMTAERYDVRMELVEKITQRLLLPFLLLLPLLAWLMWLIVGRALLPVNRVATEVSNRDPRNLAMINVSRVPSEIQPLLHAINRLFERVNESFEKEKRFTSDAAHELRTPLAAIKTHAQLARSARNDADQQHALLQIEAGVDRASHVVEQLLTLARIQPEKMRAHWQPCDLHLLAVSVAAELVPQAAVKNIDLAVDESVPVMIEGHATMLQVLLRNLLDNAIRYTPPQGQVKISFAADKPAVSISDSGKGIAESDYEKVFERFYRGEESVNGCGIGLSIVKQIAELHGATINLSRSDWGGLKITVVFTHQVE